MGKHKVKRKSTGYVFTPARQEAWRKAVKASADKRRGTRRNLRRRRYSSNPVKRGQGRSGLTKNFTPYIRVNKRSQTLGFNTGTVIPGTGRRVAFGNYIRLESTGKNKNPVDRTIGSISRRFGNSGKPAAVKKYFRDNVEVRSPAIRANIPGGQLRLGTSRGGGTTLIARRGTHKAMERKARSGVRKYETRMRTIAGGKVKSPRAQRRG